MAYYENRAVLRDNEYEIEIEVRGGVEADDMPDGLELVIRDIAKSCEKRLRVSGRVWHQFVRAVARLK